MSRDSLGTNLRYAQPRFLQYTDDLPEWAKMLFNWRQIVPSSYSCSFAFLPMGGED